MTASLWSAAQPAAIMATAVIINKFWIFILFDDQIDNDFEKFNATHFRGRKSSRPRLKMRVCWPGNFIFRYCIAWRLRHIQGHDKIPRLFDPLSRKSGVLGGNHRVVDGDR